MEKKRIFYGWWIVLGCLLIVATIIPPTAALSSVFTLPMTKDLDISRTLFSFRGLLTAAVGIVLSPIVGKKMMKGNMRLIHMISIIGYCLSLAATALVQNAIQLYIVSIFIGIFIIFSTIIPVSIYITNWFMDKRGLAMSVAMAGIGVGGFALSPILTYFLTQYNWRIAYIGLAVIIFVISFPMAAFVLYRSPKDKGLTPLGYERMMKLKAEEENRKEDDKIIEPAIKERKIKISVKDSKNKPFFIFLAIGLILNGFINAGFLSQVPPALEEMHGPIIRASIMMIYSLVGIFGKIFFGWLDDKFGIVFSSIFGCVTFGLSFVCLLFGEYMTALYLLAVVYGLSTPIATVSPPLLTSAIYNSESYPEAYGILNSTSQIGTALGSVFMSIVFDMTQSYTLIWFILLAGTILTLFLWLLAIKNSRKYC